MSLHKDDLDYLLDSFNEIFIVFSNMVYDSTEHLHTDWCKVWYSGTHKWACELANPENETGGRIDKNAGKCGYICEELILDWQKM
jgi:hypothetical protein